MPISEEKRSLFTNRMLQYGALWAGFMKALNDLYGFEDGHGSPDIEWNLADAATIDSNGFYQVPIYFTSNGVTVAVTFYWPDEDPLTIEVPLAGITLPF